MSVAAFITTAGTATFDGIERDWTMQIDRGIEWADTVGGPPKPKSKWLAGPITHDEVDAQFTAWLTGAQAQTLEAVLPPYAGTSHYFDLRLPGDSTHGAVPGFGTWDGTNFGWLIQKCTMNAPVESLGRKAPIVDLFGYRFDIHFAGGGASAAHPDYNERGGITPTPIAAPPILGYKFVAHQIQDYSTTFKPLPVDLTPAGVQHGRRRDARMALDHMSIAEADELVLWFRSIGSAAFTLASKEPFGPGQPDSVQAIARALEVTRVGAWWEASLDLTLV